MLLANRYAKQSGASLHPDFDAKAQVLATIGGLTKTRGEVGSLSVMRCKMRKKSVRIEI